jgi:reactive chlorine resistance protein C
MESVRLCLFDEAKGIQPLVAHSPLMSWMYGFLTVQGFSNGSAKASELGSATAVLMFLTTLSFLPGLGAKPRWFSRALCYARSVLVERCDLLLAAALWSFGEA